MSNDPKQSAARSSNERDGLLESLSRVQHSMGEYSLLGERVSDTAAKAIVEIKQLRATLQGIDDYIGEGCIGHFATIQEICREALNGGRTPDETEKNDG
jgi:hypothetical protein